MIDFSEEIIKLRMAKLIVGNRPLFVEIKKGDYPYCGRYLITTTKDCLMFYELKKNYRFKKKNQTVFHINYQTITGYHYSYVKEFSKGLNLKLNDFVELIMTFTIGYDQAYGNQENADALMALFKEKGIKGINHYTRLES